MLMAILSVKATHWEHANVHGEETGIIKLCYLPHGMNEHESTRNLILSKHHQVVQCKTLDSDFTTFKTCKLNMYILFKGHISTWEIFSKSKTIIDRKLATTPTCHTMRVLRVLPTPPTPLPRMLQPTGGCQ